MLGLANKVLVIFQAIQARFVHLIVELDPELVGLRFIGLMSSI